MATSEVVFAQDVIIPANAIAPGSASSTVLAALLGGVAGVGGGGGGSVTPASIGAFNSTTMRYTRTSTVPAGVGWDQTHYPVPAPSITETLNGETVGSAGITPEALFDLGSTARSAPAVTYYVSGSGSNSNDGLTTATSVRALFKAQDLANAGGVPAKILVEYAQGGYTRANGFTGGSTVSCLVDTAWICTENWVAGTGRRVTVGTWDTVSSFAADGTQTNTYSKAVTNCTRVLDLTARNRFGNNVELVPASSAAICNITPGSWFCNGTLLYINRADKLAPTDTNTRYFRNVASFQVIAQVNVFMDGFDIQGCAPTYSVFHVSSAATTDPGTFNRIVTKNVSARYGGDYSANGGGRGFGCNNWWGLIAHFNAQSDANQNDGFGGHNLYGGVLYYLTVNCTARDNGRGLEQSVNGLTAHEIGKTIDIAGVYEFNRGGAVHVITDTRTYLLGTLCKDDQGDEAAGGAIMPVGVRVTTTSELWAERVRVSQPKYTMAWQARISTAKIYRRDCDPVPQPDAGEGTYGTF